MNPLHKRTKARAEKLKSIIEFVKSIPNNKYYDLTGIVEATKIPEMTFRKLTRDCEEIKKYISYATERTGKSVYTNELTRILLIKNGVTLEKSRHG